MQGPYDLRNAVMSANGAHHLIRLLRSTREDVVLSAIQALQHICLGVGMYSSSRDVFGYWGLSETYLHCLIGGLIASVYNHSIIAII